MGKIAATIALAGTASLAALHAQAQEFNRPRVQGQDQLSIETRRNPAYDPQGARFMGFILSPSLTQGAAYNDNIYAREDNKEGDWLSTTSPALSVKSDFVRHQLNLGLQGNFGRYKNNKDEDFDDYAGKIDSRIDITGQTSVPLSTSITQDHYRRGDPEESSARKPTVFRILQASTGIVHQGQKIVAGLNGNVQKYLFDNGEDAGGTVNNKDRNRTEASLRGMIGLPAEGRIAPFIYSQVKDISYSQKRDDGGFERSAMEYEGGGGLSIALSDITRSEISLGYAHRSPDDHRFESLEALTYAIGLTWEPSTLASFKLEGTREVSETTVDNFSASVDTGLRLSVNYELWPNLLLGPSIGYLERDYQGNGSRTLTRYEGGAGVTYKLNQNFWLLGDYKYITQDGEASSSDKPDQYDSNTVSLSLKLQF